MKLPNDQGLDIASLLDGYRRNRFSPADVIETVLSRIEAEAGNETSDSHNIWITRLDAGRIQPYLDRLAGSSPADKPLYGIPFAIKDNIDLGGVTTTAACAAYAYQADRSAFVVERLIDAGAIPVGKTNMDQFATGLVGTRSPAPWGPCRNAFNKAYISGGSSSGSAVAVALGLVSFSLGTDTAGSGRVPAAFNNIVGLKPSKGLLSMRGVVPACRSLDCVSLFALTTDDANRVFEAAAVYDAADPYARPNPYANNHRHYGMPDGAFSFAVPADDQLEFFGDASARALFAQSVQSMQAIGGIEQVVDFTPFIEAARLLYEGPWVAERFIVIEQLFRQRRDALLPVIDRVIGAGENISASDAFRAEYRMQACRAQAERILAGVDFLLTPTAGTIYTIDEVIAEPVGLNSNLGYYTNFMNLLDCASVAVPAGFLDNGLPWGVSLVSGRMRDRRLLSFANRWQQYNKITPGALGLALPASTAGGVGSSESIDVIVCGAHLDGLALNWQLRERGASLLETTASAGCYRMYVIDGAIPRPGMVRDTANGVAIEIEIWRVPAAEFGGFVAGIAPPLGIGKVETRDGRWLPGFICEAYAVAGARDISALGGWRQYLANS